MAAYADSKCVFDDLSVQFSALLYERREGDRHRVNKTLDQLNTLEYRHPIVTQPKKAVLLVHQFCTLVPPDDSFLVAKCCQLMNNLVARQHVLVEGRTLRVAVTWCMQALKQCSHEVTIDILVALEALIYSNSSSVHDLVGDLIGPQSVLLAVAVQKPVFTKTLLAVQCLEGAVSPPADDGDGESVASTHLLLCLKVFLRYLLRDREPDVDDLLYCKLLSSCIRGVQNIVLQDPTILHDNLGLFLGICRTFMVYGIRDVAFLVPQKLMPSMLSVPEPSQPQKKGGKIAKQRKQRTPAVKKDTKPSVEGLGAEGQSSNRFNSPYTPANSGFDSDNAICIPINHDRLKASDSDFSDSESGLAARIGINEARFRQYALQLLLTIIKKTEKPTIFGYWSSFLSDGSHTGSHRLTVCVLKDPSPHGRSAALVVILSLLTRAKLYLSQAELNDKDTSFTTFSVTLGLMLKHIHNCLCLALSENSTLVLIQVLKCLAALVQSSPYHRLTPGLTTKIVRNVKPLVKHRDATVQVTSLIVFGCILASEPVVPETKEALLKDINKADSEQRTTHGVQTVSAVARTDQDDDDDVEYANFSSDDEEEAPSGVETSSKLPWLLDRCLRNLGVTFDDKNCEAVVPFPVKQESLQVISAMNRNYFVILLAPYLPYVLKALDVCLSDKNVALLRHAGRTADFVGQALETHFASTDVDIKMSLEQGLAFWHALLNGPLILLLQNEQDAILRAVGCDCLSNIGPSMFEQIPRDKQILCITLLFGCSRDEENAVRGAAVRALAIYVLYPSLREDIGFVMDTAEAVYRSLQDKILNVRIKASWSLGNLSDALVFNHNDQNVEDIPDDLFLKLLEICIKITNDNDKIKSNAVRAIGNFLFLMSNEMLVQSKFRLVAEEAIAALIKCCSTGPKMKIRWNSCYAIGCMLKNDVLYEHLAALQQNVFLTLSELIINFSNFKVRIKAALSLSMPQSKRFYGDLYHHVWKSLLLALENSQNMEDFSEYKHRDHLVDQICLTISHFTTLLAPDDLNKLEETFTLHLDALQSHMRKVQDRLLPEKSALLLAAASHVVALETSTNLNGNQRAVLKLLSQIYCGNAT